MKSLQLVVVPALSDNYVYLLHDEPSGTTAVIDPAEAGPVEDELERRGWRLTHILNTHHHSDHIGGNTTLKRRYGALVVGYGDDAARIPEIDVKVADGDSIAVGPLTAQVLFVPGHTRGHIAYWFRSDDLLFCGDTLFSFGCGRLFEGTPAEMWQSLARLRALPDETRVCCAHEYTASNLRFARALEPESALLKELEQVVAAKRSRGEPTLPASLAVEKRANPFLRADDRELAQAIGLAPDAAPVTVFATIRTMKDQFRG